MSHPKPMAETFRGGGRRVSITTNVHSKRSKHNHYIT